MNQAEQAEKDFREYIIRAHQAPSNVQEKQAWALFNAIQNAFTSQKPSWITEIPSDLVHNLAACAWVSLLYDQDQKIRWQESQHDYILTYLWRAFFKSVLFSVRRKQHRVLDGQIYVGCLLIPGWLTDLAAQRDIYPDLE